MSRYALVLSLLGTLLLSACSSDEHQDLKEWMQESSKDIKGKVLPLPEIKPFPIISYDAGDVLDPFNPAKIEPEKKPTAGGGALKPDLDRPREPLEAYPLESLKMVGVIRQGKLVNAVILADKTLHHVQKGSYMGQNFGKVIDINDSEVRLIESVQDPGGEWVERSTTLQLQEQEMKK